MPNPPDGGLSRRTFLASAGLSALALAVTRGKADEPLAGQPAPPEPPPRPILESINLLQGTNSSREYSRGNTLPIAALPFGMAHWTLQTQPGGGWFFRPADRRIQGLRCTHQLSPWLGDYGQAAFLPFSGTIEPDPAKRASSYRPAAARLAPHSLRLFLERYRLQVELVPTERCALIAATASTDEAPGFLFDVPGASGEVEFAADRMSVTFASQFGASGKRNAFSNFYVVRFSRPWERSELKPSADSRVGLVHFAREAAPLEARIGTSFISFAQAAVNLDRELGAQTLEQARTSAAGTWLQHLGRMEPQGGTADERAIFYSCLYRALLFPRQWHETTKEGAVVHRSTYSGGVEPGVMYADHGYWDVYRAWYPWMAVVFPDRLGDILQGWVNIYREGGWLPQFPAPGYRACMTGSLIDAVFADAAVKDITGFDLQLAYEGLKKHATTVGNPKAGYGRRGLEDYLALGYVPADRLGESAAETTDAAFGDFCIAQIAQLLGRTSDEALFRQRAGNWRHLFDPATGFLRGKNADGSWAEPFDPLTWGGAHVEGGAWQHRWDVPHDPEALFTALGGKEKAVAYLEQMLTMPPAFHIGTYNTEIHEMSEMAAFDFGQYAHSNQPVHHVLYLFAAAGRPDRTRYWVERVMREMYTIDTFAGDEDTGSMAAWYLLSACGFYGACAGKPDYTLGVPLFPRMTLRRPGGTDLVIESSGRGPVARVEFAGREIAGISIDHRSLAGGGTLTFVRSEA